MTAMWSDSAKASDWSWVTSTKVMPTGAGATSSTCICSRSLLSSAESGSSSSTLWTHDQRAGERDALALAAGKLGRAALRGRQRDLRQRLRRGAFLRRVEPQPLSP